MFSKSDCLGVIVPFNKFINMLVVSTNEIGIEGNRISGTKGVVEFL